MSKKQLKVQQKEHAAQQAQYMKEIDAAFFAKPKPNRHVLMSWYARMTELDLDNQRALTRMIMHPEVQGV